MNEAKLEHLSSKSKSEMAQKEIVERVSAEKKDPAESPKAEVDVNEQNRTRIEQITRELDKFDGQLVEFADKLDDPNVDSDTKSVIEKIMQKIAEQQTALIREREDKKALTSNDAGVYDFSETQVIPSLRRETQVLEKPTLPRFPDTAARAL